MHRFFVAVLVAVSCSTGSGRKVGTDIHFPNNGGGGGAVVSISADTSAMPTATGSLLAYMRTAGFAGPADSLMAQSSQVIGVFSNGSLTGGTQIVPNLLFTVQGGMPVVGQTVCLAGADDDNRTAQGEATADCPQIGVPFPDYLPSFQLVIRNRVEIGTVLDNSNYVSNGTCSVLVKLPANPMPPRHTGITMQGFEALPFAAGQDFEFVSGNRAMFGWGSGTTVAIVFTVENANFGNNYLWMLVDDFNTIANGWIMRETSGNMTVLQTNASTTSTANLGALGFGLNEIVASIVPDGSAHGASIHASLNGGPVVVTAMNTAIVAPASGWTMSMGRLWTLGGIAEVAQFKRAMSDQELALYSGSIHPTPPSVVGFNERWILNSTLAADQYLEWYWRALDWAPSVDPLGVAGPAGDGGAAVQFTTRPSTGSIGKVEHDEYCYWDGLPANLLDTDTRFQDSLGYTLGRPGSRYAWTQPSTNDELMVAWENDDFDGHDIMAATVLVDGVASFPNTLIPVASDAVPRYAWLRLGPTEASHHIEVVVPAMDSHNAVGGFVRTGTKIVQICGPAHAVWDTAATAARLVLVDDGPLAGHDSSNESMLNSTTQRLRADFSGRVTICGQSAQKISDLYSWGGNSMLPAARTIQACAGEGSPSSVIVYFDIGEFDFAIGFDTAATMATKYGALLDATHALMPSATIWLQQYSISHSVDSNTNPHTGQAKTVYEAAIAGLTTGRSWLHFIDVRGPNALTYGGHVPQVQFIQAPNGSQAYHDNMRDNTNGGPVF